MVITFDGASCTGKSTLARIVAKKLGYNFMNSGMIYRAVTYYLLKKSIKPDNTNDIENELSKMQIDVKFFDEQQRVYVNHFDCSDYVSTIEVTQYVGIFSQNPILRVLIESVQRDFAKSHNCVFEGRDLGSVVFPDADFKFYITCDIDVRAKRRFNDLFNENQNLTINKVKVMLEERDRLDINRKISPLIKPQNAIEIDTSKDTIEESVKKILRYIK